MVLKPVSQLFPLPIASSVQDLLTSYVSENFFL